MRNKSYLRRGNSLEERGFDQWKCNIFINYSNTAIFLVAFFVKLYFSFQRTSRFLSRLTLISLFKITEMSTQTYVPTTNHVYSSKKYVLLIFLLGKYRLQS